MSGCARLGLSQWRHHYPDGAVEEQRSSVVLGVGRDTRHEFGQANAEGARNLEERLGGWIAFAAFQTADVVSMQVRQLSQSFLA